MTFNPLAIILNQNKLTEPNYVYWKRNLNIVLTTEGNEYVLTEDHHDLSAANTPRVDLERYNKWVKGKSSSKMSERSNFRAIPQAEFSHNK